MGIRVALFRGLVIPIGGGLKILGYAPAGLIHAPQGMTGVRVTGAGRPLQQGQGFLELIALIQSHALLQGLRGLLFAGGRRSGNRLFRVQAGLSYVRRGFRGRAARLGGPGGFAFRGQGGRGRAAPQPRQAGKQADGQ